MRSGGVSFCVAVGVRRVCAVCRRAAVGIAVLDCGMARGGLFMLKAKASALPTENIHLHHTHNFECSAPVRCLKEILTTQTIKGSTAHICFYGPGRLFSHSIITVPPAVRANRIVAAKIRKQAVPKRAPATRSQPQLHMRWKDSLDDSLEELDK